MISGRLTFFLAAVGACLIALWIAWAVVSRMTDFGPYAEEETGAWGWEFSVNDYSREAFGGWIDADNDCLNTRMEILVEHSLIDPSFDETGCRVVGGGWVDVYSGEVLTDPARIDIDHVVPLHFAWDAGASSWSRAERVAFMNDAQNLALTSDRINRSKGDSLPGEWLPPNSGSHCAFIAVFLSVLRSYNLTLPRDRRILELEAQECG